MKSLVMLILLSLLCFASPQSQQSTYETLKTEAERLYAEASYSQARELYLKARAVKLQPPLRLEDARWVEFRLADTLWRSQAATQTADTTKYETAQRQLESLISERRRTEDHDRYGPRRRNRSAIYGGRGVTRGIGRRLGRIINRPSTGGREPKTSIWAAPDT